jgi:quercetin dioxygenase-like cupin family protein
MPTVVHRDALDPHARAAGWLETVLHDPGAEAEGFALARWDLGPNETTQPLAHEHGEAFLYVAEGSGRIVLKEGDAELGAETVVWLDPGDEYRLEAGEDGLAVVVASASERDDP